MIKVKICGITQREDLEICLKYRADYVGFVFFVNSKRNISLENASILSKYSYSKIKNVGLFVEPDDFFLEKVIKNVKLDFIQLHGQETVERVKKIKEKFNLPIIKALGISTKKDLLKVSKFENVSDILLLDYKTNDKILPGGSGKSFDWSILKKFDIKKPWMLAGGLNPKNVKNALKTSGTKILDVSSGVETNGMKSKKKIKSFLLNSKGDLNEQSK